MTHILQPPAKTPEGLLCAFYRQIQFEKAIGLSKFTALLHDYYNKHPQRLPKGKADLSSARNYLWTELSRPKLSWKFFCEGMSFLGDEDFDFYIRIYLPNGEQSISHVHVGLTQDKIDEIKQAFKGPQKELAFELDRQSDLSVNHALATLYQSILFSHGIAPDSAEFKDIISRYVDRLDFGETKKKKGSEKGNLHKSLTKDIMTWDVFIKGLHVLNVVKFDMAVRSQGPLNRPVDFKRSVILKEVDADHGSDNIFKPSSGEPFPPSST